MGFFQAVLYFPAVGDIIYGQEDYPLFSQHSFNLPGIQKHYAPAYGRKIMFNLIVVKCCFLGKDGFEEFPQFWDIPLLIAQVIYKLSYGLNRVYLKEFIQRTAGSDYP